MSLFNDINMYKNGQHIAKHKPLLILYLLGRAINSGEVNFTYSNIYEDANDFLSSFGASPKVNYPMWRLRNDNILLFHEENSISQNSSGDANISDLKCFGSFSFSDKIEKMIIKGSSTNNHIIKSEVENIISNYFPESWHKDLLLSTGLQVLFDNDTIRTKKKRDPNFKNEVAIAYNYKCAVCGFNIAILGKSTVNEAAHIKWHAYNGPDIVSNGLLLCPTHHKIFDRGIFTINKKLKIEISKKVSASKESDLLLFNYLDKEIRTPRNNNLSPKEEYLKWHKNKVFII